MTARRHRVVLVRGPRRREGSGGCCAAGGRPFDEGADAVRDSSEDPLGQVYRRLRAALPATEVDIEVVDPANWLWLVPALVTDGRRRGMAGRQLLASVRSGLAVSSVVVDGAVLFSGELPSPEAAVAAVQAELARA